MRALLKEKFDSIHSPPNLSAVLSNPVIRTQLQTLRTNRVLTHPEWKSLYNPSGTGTYGKSADFDISLLCINGFEKYAASLLLLLDGQLT